MFRKIKSNRHIQKRKGIKNIHGFLYKKISAIFEKERNIKLTLYCRVEQKEIFLNAFCIFNGTASFVLLIISGAKNSENVKPEKERIFLWS